MTTVRTREQASGFATFSFASPYFFTYGNFTAILFSTVVIGTLAIGTTFVHRHARDDAGRRGARAGAVEQCADLLQRGPVVHEDLHRQSSRRLLAAPNVWAS